MGLGILFDSEVFKFMGRGRRSPATVQHSWVFGTDRRACWVYIAQGFKRCHEVRIVSTVSLPCHYSWPDFLRFCSPGIVACWHPQVKMPMQTGFLKLLAKP